jgi:tetratricopeptide (TPR) repeat protein
MGLYPKAEPLSQRGLQIREAKLGKDHPDVAISLNNLALLYDEMGQHAKAEALYRRSLQIREAKLGKDHPDVATSLDNLGSLYRVMDQYAKAEPLLQRGLDIREAKLGKDHPDVAQSLNSLARLYLDMGHYGKAGPLYLRGLNIREAKLGKDHPIVSQSLTGLACCNAEQSLWREAAELYDQSRRIQRRLAAQVLPMLAPRQQKEFLAGGGERKLTAGLSFGVCFGDEPLVRRHTAAWLLNGKAMTLETASVSRRSTQFNDDPGASKIASELVEVRQQLAKLMLNPARASSKDVHDKEREQLLQREQDLARQLNQLGNRWERPKPWVEFDELTGCLPKSGVFVDIARFDFGDYKAKVG